MKYGLLAKKTRYFKKEEKGVRRMSKIMDEIVDEIMDEVLKEEREEVALSLLKDGTLSISKIAEVSKLPEDKVKELAEELQPIATR